MEGEQTGVRKPAGVAYSPRANGFYLAELGSASADSTTLVEVDQFAGRSSEARLGALVQDPLNMAYDQFGHRLLILQPSANRLLEIREGTTGHLDMGTLRRHDIGHLDLHRPAGISIDPGSGDLFVLEQGGPRILAVAPGAAGDFTGTLVSRIDLQSKGLDVIAGLAFDPATGHLQTIDSSAQKLYELTQAGDVVATRDLSPFGLHNPRGMTFAPSGDQTDDPQQLSLYVADSGQSGATPQATQLDGSVMELSLVAPTTAGAIDFQSTLVKTTDMAAYSPPSPDPSGLAYLPNSNTLLMTDGEVDETVSGITHFQGANAWEITLGGSVVRTANISKVAPTVVPMTNEPTGVAWNRSNGHYYVTDDDARRVYDLNPGADQTIGTADDRFTYFDTSGAGSGDPEGIAYDSWSDRIFVADGVNAEIYQFTTTGSPVGHFDVQIYGVVDPESVEFNVDTGTLFVLSNHTAPIIVETTRAGALLQTVDVSADNALAPAGLAYAPASDGSGAKHFYIVDRGIDNNTDPRIIDGKMYEMAAPPPSTATATTGPTWTPTNSPTATPLSTVTPTGTPTATTTPAPTGTLPGLTTVALQPNGAAGLDTYVSNSSLNSNFGSLAYLKIGEDGTGVNKITRSLLQFDLSAIPPDATITSASLSLWLYGNTATNSHDIQVFRLLRPWREVAATWNVAQAGTSWQVAGAGGDLDRESTNIGHRIVLYNEPNGEKVFSLDPAKIQEMVSGAFANNGFILSADGELDDQHIFRSSDATKVGQRPELTIQYTVTGNVTPTTIPTNTATPTDTPAGGPTNTPTNTPTDTPTSTSTPTPVPTGTSSSDRIFADGFESGDLSAWSSSKAGTGQLSVSPSAAITGNYGLHVTISSTTTLYVTNELGSEEPSYRARFYFDPNSIAMVSGNAHYLLIGYDALTPTGGSAVFNLDFRSSSGAYQIRLRQQNDSQATLSTPWVTITDAPHAVEMRWWAASGVGANDGGVELWIDGIIQGSLSGLDNDTRRIQRIRFGAVSDIDAGTLGTYYLDSFESRRQTYIGP